MVLGRPRGGREGARAPIAGEWGRTTAERSAVGSGIGGVPFGMEVAARGASAATQMIVGPGGSSVTAPMAARNAKTLMWRFSGSFSTALQIASSIYAGK